MGTPRVDFYVVGGGRGADQVACRVAEKAFLQGLTVLVRTGSDERARRLDELLWTFSGASFVPHALAGEAEEGISVLIGADVREHAADLLINLADGPPDTPDRFQRIAEVVGPGEGERRSGRERFRYYRDHFGMEPTTHRLNG